MWTGRGACTATISKTFRPSGPTGLLFVAVEPPLLLAQILMYGFVLARLAHAVAYVTKQMHEVRATFYTIGSVAVIAMALYVLAAVVS